MIVTRLLMSDIINAPYCVHQKFHHISSICTISTNRLNIVSSDLTRIHALRPLMAVFTPLTLSEAQSFWELYRTKPIKKINDIVAGVENSNFLVREPDELFILTIFEQRSDIQGLSFCFSLMDYLADSGFAPKPLRRLDQSSFTSLLKNKPAGVVSFIEGQALEQWTLGHVSTIGALLAQMHIQTDQITEEAIPVRHNPMNISVWEDLLEGGLHRAPTDWHTHAEALRADLQTLQKNWPNPQTESLPLGPVHADLFPDNVLFEENTVQGVIDYYFACTETRIYDLAVTLNAWCFNDQEPTTPINPEHLKELLNAYTGQKSLSSAEQRWLPLICMGAAMRFLSTRLYDWSLPDEGTLIKRKDPQPMLNRLIFWRELVARGGSIL